MPADFTPEPFPARRWASALDALSRMLVVPDE